MRVWILLLCLPALGWAKSNKLRIDVSTGIAFPSDSSAVNENPAALRSSMSTFEIQAGPYDGPLVSSGGSPSGGGGSDNSYAGDVSYVGGGKKSGLGLGLNYLPGPTWNARGGFGFGNLAIGFGVGVDYDVTNKNARYSGGVQFGGKFGMVLAAALRFTSDGFDEVAVALGYRAFGAFQFEVDAIRQNTQGRTFLDPALGIQLGPSFSLVGGYRLPLQQDNEKGKFRAGANIWLGKSVAISYLYRFKLTKHLFGLKMALR